MNGSDYGQYMIGSPGNSGDVWTSMGEGRGYWSAIGNGAVTSVGLSLPSEFSISNSPVTGTGTLTGAWIEQDQGFVLAAPVDSTGAPTFRFLADEDIPDTITLNNITQISNRALSSLTGLDQDNLAIYALLAGRAGGQTLTGGINANDALILRGNAASSGNTANVMAMQLKVGNSGATNALTILNNGNIGIGTTNPTQRLAIQGSGITSASAAMNVTNASSTSMFYVRNDGNVGINTNAPGYKLEVYNGDIVAKGGTGASGGYYLGMFKGTGSLPGFPSDSFPTIKTDYSQLYFSIGGSYSAYVTSGGTWNAVSARERKENFTDVDPQIILSQIDQMPMLQWNYIGEDPSIKHIGPIAQDFHALFGLNGPNDKMISQVDPSGVALVGIKALSAKVSNIEAQLTSNGLLVLLNATSTDATSTDPLSDPAPLSGFAKLIKNTLASLGMALENGIASLKEATLDKLTTKLVKTDQLCLDDVCVNKEQFKELLKNSNIPQTNIPAATEDPGIDENNPVNPTNDDNTAASSTEATDTTINGNATSTEADAASDSGINQNTSPLAATVDIGLLPLEPNATSSVDFGI
jgi:hypothetical protein